MVLSVRMTGEMGRTRSQTIGVRSFGGVVVCGGLCLVWGIVFGVGD
jgi:hypothetical protein